MKINGREIKGTSYAYDGCYRIYICENKEEEAEAGAPSGQNAAVIQHVQRAV